MEPETIAALLISIVVVPFAAWTAYQFGVRQDRQKWLREQRAELYVDLLVEGYAEKQWCIGQLVHREMIDASEPGDPYGRVAEWKRDRDQLIPDVRLEPVARAKLGARMAAYSTPEVARLFNAIGQGVLHPLPSGWFATTYTVETAFDQLEARIREELGNPRKQAQPMSDTRGSRHGA